VTGNVVNTTLNDGKSIASFTVETENGTVRVGGRVAALEDIEAREISIERP